MALLTVLLCLLASVDCGVCVGVYTNVLDWPCMWSQVEQQSLASPPFTSTAHHKTLLSIQNKCNVPRGITDQLP